MAQRISLRGLQIGEEISISTCGLIQRKGQAFNAGEAEIPTDVRLDASALCRGPEQVMYVAELLNQFLRAMGEPFELQYEKTRRADGTLYTKVDRIFKGLFQKEMHSEGDDTKLPKIAKYGKSDDIFYAIFVVAYASN